MATNPTIIINGERIEVKRVTIHIESKETGGHLAGENIIRIETTKSFQNGETFINLTNQIIKSNPLWRIREAGQMRDKGGATKKRSLPSDVES